MKKRMWVSIGVLTILSVCIFHAWFSFSVFLNGDWNFWGSEYLKEFRFTSFWSIKDYGLGAPDEVFWAYPRNFLASIFGLFGFDWNVAEKVIILWPIVFLLPLACFLLLERMFRNAVVAFVGSLYFSLNSYFLAIN
ncbi:MAG: hypothetical protein EOM19_07475 [Candidatus Moranbacteria bacterium]|nr:hypothetical protein [Candidatus Moranbacteria bacterium]